MSRKLILAFSFSLFICCSTSIHSQGPWIPKKGLSYVQTVFSSVSNYDVIYGENGVTQSTPRTITDNTLSAYGEVGISECFGVTANVPFSFLSSGSVADSTLLFSESGNLNGLGNISVAGKYRLLNKKVKVSLIGQVDLQTSKSNSNLGLNTGLNATTILPRLAIGSSGNEWYAYANAGYGLRNNNHHDLFLVVLEGGYKLGEKSTIILNITSFNNMDNGEDVANEAVFVANGLYSSVQEFQAFNLKYFMENVYSDFGFFVGFGGGSGEFVAAAPALSVGLFGKW